jgi:hypothetical protein
MRSKRMTATDPCTTQQHCLHVGCQLLNTHNISKIGNPTATMLHRQLTWHATATQSTTQHSNNHCIYSALTKNTTAQSTLTVTDICGSTLSWCS